MLSTTKSYGVALRGTDLPQSKLDEATVREIRARHAEKERQKKALDEAHSHEALAREYRVHPNTIGKILSYATWRHVR